MVVTRQERPRGMDLLLQRRKQQSPGLELHRKALSKTRRAIYLKRGLQILAARQDRLFRNETGLSRTTGGLFSPLSFTEIKRSHVHHLFEAPSKMSMIVKSAFL